MNYPQVSIETAAKELCRLHEGIELKLRTTVQDAIRAGEILSQVKEKLGHGAFLPWVSALPFSERSAQNYMRLYAHKDKTATLADLQSAYKQIESIEHEEKRKEWERKDRLIKERQKTGTKPEGWDRSLDYEYKKRIDDEAYEKRKKEAFEKTKKVDDGIDHASEAKRMLDDLANNLRHQEAIKYEQEKRYSTVSGIDEVFACIGGFIKNVNSDSGKLEALNSLIKYCKDKAITLQKKSVGR